MSGDIDSPRLLCDNRGLLTLKEDATQKGSGEFQGCNGCVWLLSLKKMLEVIQVNNIDQDGDGYMNRSYVGTWRSYKNPLRSSSVVCGAITVCHSALILI